MKVKNRAQGTLIIKRTRGKVDCTSKIVIVCFLLGLEKGSRKNGGFRV